MYWTHYRCGAAQPAGAVWKRGLAGGPAVPLGPKQDTSVPHARPLALDANAIYICDEYGTILKVGKSGEVPVVLADTGSRANGIAVDADAVYWTLDDRVMKVGLDGGTPETIASNQKEARGIAVDGSYVYWATDGTVMKVALAGGTAVTLATNQLQGSAIAVSADALYWTALGGIQKIGLSGESPMTLVQFEGLESPLALGPAAVFWYNNITRVVNRMGLSGGGLVKLASDVNGLTGLGVSSDAVFWSAGFAHESMGIVTYDGSIWRAEK